MIITFIQVKISWCKRSHISWNRMEPAIYAKLKALTPNDIKCKLIDTRFEKINFNKPTDFVVMSLTTLNAKYAYEIADEYRKRGVKVILGGIHVNLCPNEALEHADALSIGESELIWADIIKDAQNGTLRKIYKSEGRYDLKNYTSDISIFKGKHYMPVHCVETSRGCLFKCEFCSLAPMYNQQIVYREADDVIKEISSYKEPFIVFIDENFGNNIEHTSAILKKLIPLKKRWSAQMSVNSLQDFEFVKLMRESGCINVFIGFESVDRNVLESMHKVSNFKLEMYENAMDNCAKNDIAISCGFLNGYIDNDADCIDVNWEFANSFQFFNCSYINLIPIPGTPAYQKLKEAKHLVDEKWWLSDIFYYNRKPLFYSKTHSDDSVQKQGFDRMVEFLSFKNIFKRFLISKYKPKTRLMILFMNLFLKYNFKAFGG